jgi:hypothetical protein
MVEFKTSCYNVAPVNMERDDATFESEDVVTIFVNIEHHVTTDLIKLSRNSILV